MKCNIQLWPMLHDTRMYGGVSVTGNTWIGAQESDRVRWASPKQI
jgi:hypothetical protein